MALFRRKGAPSPAGSVPEFWSWWTTEGAAACAAALAQSEPERMAPEISARVDALHPELSWELAAGQVSAHQLVVTAEGNPALRSLARRWLLAAPPADPIWSYDDHRGAATDPEGIVLQGSPGAPEVDFRDVRIGARMQGSRVDVTVHHPAFTELDEQSRLQVAFLALDAALGENETELWVGEINASAQPPMDGFGLVALQALVGNLRRQNLDADGRPGWALLQGQGPRGPILVTARSPLHPVFGPLLTRHVTLDVAYAEQTAEGLPGPGSLEDLRALEDSLEAALGQDGMLVAHESTAGHRLFHLYVDPESQAAARLEAAAGGRGRLRGSGEDPGWEGVRHLRS